MLIVGALLYYWHSTFYEDTDDAQVNGHIIQISARIQGHVVNVPVKENQEVAAGTLIAEIDPHDYEVLVAQDEANLEAAEAAYEAAKVNVPVTNTQSFSSLSSASANVQGSSAQVKRAMQLLDQAQAEVAQAEANNTKSQLDLKRYTPLVEKDVISKQQYDQAVVLLLGDHILLHQRRKALQVELRLGVVCLRLRHLRLRLLQQAAGALHLGAGTEDVRIGRRQSLVDWISVTGMFTLADS